MFCTAGPHLRLYVGDFNGDSRSDLLCHDYMSGQKFQLFAQHDGTFTDEIW